jgi:hypothetical protein
MARQADFDIRRAKAQLLTTNLMFRRAKRVFDILTDAAQQTNTAAAASIPGGSTGKWDTGTSASPQIQLGINAVVEIILQNTFYTIDPNDIWMIINPTAAHQLAETDEIRDLIKYAPSGVQFLQSVSPFSNAPRFGLPAMLFGVNVMVAAFRHRTSVEGAASDTDAYMIDDDACFVTSMPPSLQTLNTITTFEYEPMRVEEHRIPWEHRTLLQVITNYDVKLTAVNSGYLVTDIYD